MNLGQFVFILTFAIVGAILIVGTLQRFFQVITHSPKTAIAAVLMLAVCLTPLAMDLYVCATTGGKFNIVNALPISTLIFLVSLTKRVAFGVISVCLTVLLSI